MNRLSKDELAKDGTILNGFDYHIQVWVVNGICTDVGIGAKYQGQPINTVLGHEVRDSARS